MDTQENLDTVKLMSLFPNEIWLLVLNHVDNFKDYLRICNASSFLKTALQTLRTKVLFPDVIKILQAWGYKEVPTLSIEELLTLRLVCSSWKFGVNKILHHLDDPYFPRICPEFLKAGDFAKYEEPLVSNPFLARAVKLSFAPLPFGDLSEYYSGLMTMFKNFGHNIWYCKIEVNISKWKEQVTFFKKLATILELMPNLHRLTFSSGSVITAKLVLPDDHFPTLNKLEAIKQERMPVLVFQKLVKRNPQITQVKCGPLPSEFLNELPNLEDVDIEIQEIDHFNQFCDATVACRLTKLHIDLKSLKVSWNKVFTALESKFGETLQDLEIDLPDPKFHTKRCRLNLPNLKNLWLSMERPANLDFIVPMKHHLENLDITFRQSNSSVVDLNQGLIDVYFCCLYNSNIWEMFGKLKCLKKKLHPYPQYKSTRKAWEIESQSDEVDIMYVMKPQVPPI